MIAYSVHMCSSGISDSRTVVILWKMTQSQAGQKKKNLNELVEKVHEMIAYDVNLIVRWIAEELNTTKDMIHEILTKDLNK